MRESNVLGIKKIPACAGMTFYFNRHPRESEGLFLFCVGLLTELVHHVGNDIHNFTNK